MPQGIGINRLTTTWVRRDSNQSTVRFGGCGFDSWVDSGEGMVNPVMGLDVVVIGAETSWLRSNLTGGMLDLSRCIRWQFSSPSGWFQKDNPLLRRSGKLVRIQ